VKKQLGLAVISGVLASGVHAENSVTLYGSISTGITYMSNQRTTALPNGNYVGHSNTILYGSGPYYGDRWGFKGSEDLGGGTRAIFQLENGFNVANGALGQGGRLFGRQAYVGLADDRYGQLTMGRQYDPPVDMVGSIIYAYGGGTFTHPGDVDQIDANVRFNNSVRYNTPTIAGFKFSGMYALNGTPGSVADGSAYSFGASYNRGPLSAAASFTSLRNGTSTLPTTWTATTDSIFTSSINEGLASSRSLQFAVLAAGYKFDKLNVGISYSNSLYRPQRISTFYNTAVFNDLGLNFGYVITPTIIVSGSYNFLRRNAMSGAGGDAGSATYNQVTAALDYLLSKRTILYAVVGYQHASGQAINAKGQVVNATASVGDLLNGGFSSATGNQIAPTIGIRHFF
jgi:predicted porin